MVPDRQKVWTDGRKDRRNGRCQNYIPPTLSGDKNNPLLLKDRGGGGLNPSISLPRIDTVSTRNNSG